MASPYPAKTNKSTWFIRLISTSVQLPAGTPVTVYNVVGPWADVSATPTGENQASHGSVLIDDIT